MSSKYTQIFTDIHTYVKIGPVEIMIFKKTQHKKFKILFHQHKMIALKHFVINFHCLELGQSAFQRYGTAQL